MRDIRGVFVVNVKSARNTADVCRVRCAQAEFNLARNFYVGDIREVAERNQAAHVCADVVFIRAADNRIANVFKRKIGYRRSRAVAEHTDVHDTRTNVSSDGKIAYRMAVAVEISAETVNGFLVFFTFVKSDKLTCGNVLHTIHIDVGNKFEIGLCILFVLFRFDMVQSIRKVGEIVCRADKIRIVFAAGLV